LSPIALKNSDFLLTLICLSLSNYCYTAQFTRQKASYLFAPGLTSYETQIARYIPEYTAITGEKISCKNGIHAINEPITICKFPEIKLQSTKNRFKNPVDWTISKLMILRNILCGVEITNTNPDAKYTINGHTAAISKINLAQEADIEALSKSYNKHITEYPDSDVTGFATSRGAATTFSAIAQNKLPLVKIVILEGIFDSIPHLLKHKFKLTYKMVRSIITKVTSYKNNGISPDQSVSTYPKDLPTLLVSSKKDEVVPHCCTKSLYRKLKDRGCKVHFLVLENAGHSGYSTHNQQDKDLYEQVLHAFYKHYDQAHDPRLAELGSAAWQKILNQ